jgi:hypothetical protein
MTKWIAVFLTLCFSTGIAETDPNLTPSQDEGVLRLPAGISVNVTGPDGVNRMIEPENGWAALPVGSYKFNYWNCQMQDAQGNLWRLKGYGPIKEFQVGPEPVELDIKPEPVEAVLDVRCRGDYLFTLSLKGPAGERLYLYGGENPNGPPPIVITNQDKTFSVTLTGKYG